ncbi:molybdopterin cofactor-binding domain-containing protein [Acetobacter malorum]|uniref:xanthine dehydrogenase family protein molybdopterin-binding subunit n=1 Tax=Acetobacter malorum TaxID=178901 RepID=UPI0039E8BAB8
MTILTPSRRGFLAGAAGLIVAVTARGRLAHATDAENADFAPNAFVRVDRQGMISVVSPFLEMGQGSFTGIATLVAEEIDADWSKVQVIPAEIGNKDYINPTLAKHGMPFQGTGGSSSLLGAWQNMRKAGAAARALFISAAAQSWGVPPESLTVSNGIVSHSPSDRHAAFGDLVDQASKLPVPQDVPLKDPKDYKLVGREHILPRVDVAAKVDGSAIYTQDIKLPGMLVAVIAHPPTWGATLRHVDDRAAKAIPGVIAVVTVPGDKDILGGVAVLAKNTWIARQGRDALKIEWDNTHAFSLDTKALFATYRDLSKRPGVVVTSRGTVQTSAPDGGHMIEATYEQPYLSHAAMEPMNCLVKLEEQSCEVWNGEQFQTLDQMMIAKELGLKPEQVTINQLYAGGSFGRRANPRADYLRETVRIAVAAKAQGVEAPVKLVWMREDDMRGGQYRPMTVHRAQLALDGKGRITSWHHVIVGQTFVPSPPEKVDRILTEGLPDLPYDIPNFKVEQHIATEAAVPTQWLRSVGHTHSAFACESLIDDAARLTKQDPYQFRRSMLGKSPRHLAVLDLAARAYGWDRPLEPGRNDERRGRGITVWQSFGTYLSEVAEVTVHTDGSFTVDRVVCAVDCGRPVNPDIIRAQIEGGVGFGLSFLNQAITLRNGRIEQGNFNDYPVLRMNGMPRVEVHIMPSEETPSGVGEPGVPPIAPAVGNAIAAATGQPQRTLPIGTLDLRSA